MAFVEVSKEQFFQAVGGPENIHPTPHPDCSEWKNLSTHEVVGRSEPGYKSAQGTPHRYWLTEQFANRKSIKTA
ncbi:hypothetical protein IPC1108_28325 [Pseudomonas aeruginosa]|uniref:hypothetical protein n=1 Tax=Pseudomonas aeruginosa TaxID=287 RepID=UPI000EAF51A7|nr:hypothetical protein [Pseudomonas aeruginosa]RUF39983.1 hypothetical protein IPC1108_28325 [Pseudomonas aeruginosa]HBP1789752.1 hypothetical protein [Pseudomonas aeruginosa]HCF7142239.1 hypothetical protein [Pseudomonas aeruginosa]HCF7149267.1 hypothetical protein [Pseudomonas aeruginosa]HEJ2002161.1 hypothetical protein [Pseudomonas aeruginosa]